MAATPLLLFSGSRGRRLHLRVEHLLELIAVLSARRRARIEAALDAKQEELRAAIHQLARELHQDAVRSGREMSAEAQRLRDGE